MTVPFEVMRFLTRCCAYELSCDPAPDCKQRRGLPAGGVATPDESAQAFLLSGQPRSWSRVSPATVTTAKEHRHGR